MDKNFRILNLDISYDENEIKNKPWKPTLAYAIFGFLWILFSDKILSALVEDRTLYEQIQTYKGWLYVIVTAVVLYVLIKMDNFRIFELTKQLTRKNEELVAFSEELVAMEEELEKKLVSLNVLTKEMRHQKEFIEAIYNSSNMVIMVWKPDGTIVNYNEHFKELFKYDNELIGQNWKDRLIYNKGAIDVSELGGRVIREKTVENIESEITNSSGEVLNMVWNMSLITDPLTNEPIVASYGANITGERQKEKRLVELATTDVLTKLKNRVAFDNEVNDWLYRGQNFTMYLIGLDNFKYLNDVYGHLYGDVLLEKIGYKLEQEFGHQNVYRWGGDEFLLIDDKYEDRDVEKKISQLMTIMTKKWNIKELEYRSSASIGIVKYPDNGSVLDNLKSNLDVTLNHAKQSGKSQHKFFSDDLIESIRYEAAIENELKGALINDQLELYFQPIYDMVDDKVVSMETLLRWPNNNVGERNIGKVISVAEKTGQIIMVDRWVIANVFKIICKNKDAFGKTVISINISAQSFNSKKFIDYLNEQIDAYHISPSQIELEITEYSIVEDLEKSTELISEIKSLGVRISLDDFGTKYSSLNYLSKLPFDVLKIDKSYIDHILLDKKDQAIVSHLTSLAGDLELNTIVEGVEFEEQKDMLLELGCRYGQGYLFARPLPLKETLSLLKAKSGKSMIS